MEQGELSARLQSIYVFCIGRLDAVRIQRDPAKIEEVSRLLGEVREAWSTSAATAA